MKFKQVAYKNFKANIRKYMSYFICSSFTIMVFFMYMTLIFNNEIMEYTKKNKADIIFVMIITVITIFSIFFINYSHFSFTSSRGREFGLYMTLGMSKSDIGRIIFIENALIAAFSIIAGILLGTVFSRLFFLAVIKILNLPDIAYKLNLFPFVTTMLTFAAIFSVVIIISRFVTGKLEISELIKQDRKIQKEKMNHPKWGILGLSLLLIYLVGIIIFGAKKSNNFIIMESLLVVGFAGIFFILSGFGSMLMILLRKNKNIYYKNIIGITEINHKFRQNKNIVFIISVLSAVIICLLSVPISMYPQMEKISEKMLFADLQYVQLGDINNIAAEQLENILNSGETPVTGHSLLEFINGNMVTDGKPQNKLIVSEKKYMQATGRTIQVDKGYTVNTRYNTFSGKPILPDKQVELTAGGSSFNFNLQDEYPDNLLSMKSCPADSLLIVNENDYVSLKSSINAENIGQIHLISFKDWHNAGGIYEKLNEVFKISNKNPMAPYFELGSRNEFYTAIKNVYSMFLFITSFSAILFFIASACILFFKQYTELEDVKRKYWKLFKIGILKKEAIKLVSSEMKLTYFLPVILGFIIGYPLLYAESGLFMGFYHAESLRDSLMPNALWVVALYLVFQIIFFTITKKKYILEVIGNT